MIVACDNCGARYKLDDDRISGRGARVTCPKCRHVFVVYRHAESPPAAEADGSAPVQEEVVSVQEEASGLDAHELDFRKVGIQSWKVKVKIGLVYDFSDFKTINKYIREGRVTGSDLLSHDGQTWTPISDIPDLAAHFCEVYVSAQRNEALPTADVSADEPNQAPSETLSTDLNDALANAMADADENKDAFDWQGRNEPTTRFVDPFDNINKRTSPRNPPKNRSVRASSEPESRRGGFLLTAFIVTVVAGSIIGYTQFKGKLDAVSAVTEDQRATTQESTAPNAEDIRREMLEKLQDEMNDVPATVPDEGVDEWGIPEEPELRVVVPEEFRTTEEEAEAAQADSEFTDGGFSSRLTAQDHINEGDQAAIQGSWALAIVSYRKATIMEPGNGVWWEKLGSAQYQMGDLADAQNSLEQAINYGAPSAHKWLGRIARSKGDDGAAIPHYMSYLNTGPADAAAIQQEIADINGG